MYKKVLENKCVSGTSRVSLQVHEKEKKLHLSRKNISNCLAFAKNYEQWTINDWSHVISSNKTKINSFF